jgi:hypothetical protein
VTCITAGRDIQQAVNNDCQRTSGGNQLVEMMAETRSRENGHQSRLS